MSESPVIGHYINGRVNDGDGQRYSDVFNPAIGTVQARVALASVKTVDEAVAAAKAAFLAGPIGRRCAARG